MTKIVSQEATQAAPRVPDSLLTTKVIKIQTMCM